MVPLNEQTNTVIDAVGGVATTIRDGVDVAAFDLPARNLLAVFGEVALLGSLATADGSDAGVSSRGILPQEFGPGQRLADVEDEILRTVLRIVAARRPPLCAGVGTSPGRVTPCPNSRGALSLWSLLGRA